MSEKPTPEDRALGHRIVQEMRELRDNELPKPAADWDTIWPLTGYEKSLDPNEKREGKVNEHRERLETGIDLLRQVTAVRLNKPVAEITTEDISAHGPTLYFNGLEKHNEELRQMIADGRLLKKFHIDGKSIRITERQDIMHTGHQFEDFPEDLAKQSRKVVIVSDIYHLPRVRRYLFPQEKVVLYPSQHRAVGIKNALREARKIPRYVRSGLLPPEQEKK